MTDTPYLVSQNMFRNVETFNTPHGQVCAWESLYPEDRGTKYRYVVTLAGQMRRTVLESFERDGFINVLGLTRAEAVKDARNLARLSQRTQEAVDDIHRKMLLDAFELCANKYWQTTTHPR